MLYLLDTNIYISFYDRAYWFDTFPSFWENFVPIMNRSVVLPTVVLNEIRKSDEFHQWLNETFNGDFLNHKDYAEEWGEVLSYIDSSPFYSQNALQTANSWAHDDVADGWLIAIAKKEGYTIVSNETKNPNLNVAYPSKGVKIPDVALHFGIRSITMRDFFKEVGLKV